MLVVFEAWPAGEFRGGEVMMKKGPSGLCRAIPLVCSSFGARASGAPRGHSCAEDHTLAASPCTGHIVSTWSIHSGFHSD